MSKGMHRHTELQCLRWLEFVRRSIVSSPHLHKFNGNVRRHSCDTRYTTLLLHIALSAHYKSPSENWSIRYHHFNLKSSNSNLKHVFKLCCGQTLIMPWQVPGGWNRVFQKCEGSVTSSRVRNTRNKVPMALWFIQPRKPGINDHKNRNVRGNW